MLILLELPTEIISEILQFAYTPELGPLGAVVSRHAEPDSPWPPTLGRVAALLICKDLKSISERILFCSIRVQFAEQQASFLDRAAIPDHRFAFCSSLVICNGELTNDILSRMLLRCSRLRRVELQLTPHEASTSVLAALEEALKALRPTEVAFALYAQDWFSQRATTALTTILSEALVHISQHTLLDTLALSCPCVPDDFCAFSLSDVRVRTVRLYNSPIEILPGLSPTTAQGGMYDSLLQNPHLRTLEIVSRIDDPPFLANMDSAAWAALQPRVQIVEFQ